MIKFELLKSLPQPQWALLPFLDKPPTILDFKRHNHLYRSDVIEQGVYRITVSKEAIHSRGEELLLVNSQEWWDYSSGKMDDFNIAWKSREDKVMKISSSNFEWVNSLAKGTIVYYNGIFEFIGVFEKNGNVIHFNTLHEETKSWQI